MTYQMHPISDLQADEIDLAAAVNDKLDSLDIVRESGLNLQVKVISKTVTVSGVVLSRLMKHAVLDAVRHIPNVEHVIDSLYTDTDLSFAISQALANDPITKQIYGIRVTSYRGIVTLVGAVTDASTLQSVTELASHVPGVRTVISRLTLR